MWRGVVITGGVPSNLSMMRWILAVSLLYCLLITKTAAESHADLQIEWIRKNGGFFSPKVEFQLLDKNDEDSPYGIFALQDIEKNETLMVIPQACLVTSGGSLKTCDTTRNLVEQRKLGEASKYAPYVNYVFDPKHRNQLPASWSDKGKHLIETIVGLEMPPWYVTDVSFEDECGGSGDPLEEEAHLIVLRRSWDDILVPVYDMINHRNGKWYNVDSNSAHDGKDITVFASRDVKAGEQLYLSYNECADCIGYAWTYVLPQILKDYGFVEQYPRRWNFEDLAFEIDEDEETNELKLTFLTGEPNAFQLKFMRAHLKRLRNLKDYVTTHAEKLESEHERYTSLEYYDALTFALDFALRQAEANADTSKEEACSVAASGDSQTCAFREYDALETLPEKTEFNDQTCDYGRLYRKKAYKQIYKTKSHYQSMVYRYNKDLDDTCLHMNDHLHACASFRPHYHEVFVHYPARFVDEVKRVAFIGGGDNMIVHEILKYPSLELALGLELDQTVVRTSFRNFGTQPHFDDERLQWWFGDGSKSILMLPEEYYGTFDVVYVDLQSDVVDFLKVADKLSITDAAMLLLKPDGVIARNEDWDFGTDEPFTDYAVDIFYVDIPVIGYQGITLGSNTVDFLNQAPKDHGVETIYMDSVDEVEDRFDRWYNYRKSSNRTDTLCKEPGADDKILLTQELRSSLGLLLIIEAEDAAVPLESSESVQGIIRGALKNAELSETAVKVTSDAAGYEIVFVLKEGYVIIRVWPELKYCAFDIMLWSSTYKMEMAKAQLVAAVDSKSVSSYRILTSGMFGISDDNASRVGPRIKKPCDQSLGDETAQGATAEQSTFDTVLSESLSLIHDTNACVVVLCGEESSPCNSMKVLKEHGAIGKVVPVWACPSVQGASPDIMMACESKTLSALEELGSSISGIVIDSGAPRAMGQVLHKILSNSRNRRKLLAENHVVLSASVDPSESLWRRALVDRFRTDIVKFDPAYRAEVLLDKLDLNIFSSGDEHLYSNLTDVLAAIETKTGISPDVRDIKNGVNNYIADFKASRTFTHEDYDDTAPLQQWQSQDPIEVETVYQFTAKKLLSTSSVEKALQNALNKLNDDEGEEEFKVYENVGDGSVIVVYWPQGSLVAVWDGSKTVSVNLLSLQHLEKFEADLKKHWTIASLDEMPRGIGKVVNFREDVKERDNGQKFPHWAEEIFDDDDD